MSRKEAKPIRVKLTAEDYAAFNTYHGRWQLAGLFVFYWALFVIFAELSGVTGESSRLEIVIPVAFVLSALMLAFQLWRIRARTVKMFESDKFSKSEQHIEMTEEGIRHTNGDTTVVVAWEDVFKAAETSGAIILYLSRNKVIMLPKRDIADLSEVKISLRHYLPAVKLKLKA